MLWNLPWQYWPNGNSSLPSILPNVYYGWPWTNGCQQKYLSAQRLNSVKAPACMNYLVATTVPAYRKRKYTGRQTWSALRYVPGRNWPTIVYSARDCRVLTLAKLSAGLPKPNNPSRRGL